MEVTGISEEVSRFFRGYDWPGNVRELQHLIEGAMNLMSDETVIDYNHLPIHHLRRKPQNISALQPPQPSHLPAEVQPGAFMQPSPFADVHPLKDAAGEVEKPLKEKLKEFENIIIRKTVEKYEGNISRAARELGISRQSLQYRLRKLKGTP